MENNRAKWSGQLAFILAGAASAIGLGNLWRFPYLAARYGGATFILCYVLLAFTLGFVLMVTEIAIGRRTQQSQITAFGRLHSKHWDFLGILGTIVPVIILPYYCVLGGWVLYYLKTYAIMAFTGAQAMGDAAAASGAFFNGFISAPFAPYGYTIVFVLASAAVILLGVKNGIEKSNLVMMPLLFLMAIAIAVYVVFMPGSLEGLKYYLVPSVEPLLGSDGTFSLALLGKILLGATGQMFYSLSIAMGILITYGSYMKRTDSIEKSVFRIEICDTIFAVLAGLMIIPVVYVFALKTGTPVKEALNAGPGLMFITLPKVFATFGGAGAWIGLLFFLLVFFAAATSTISMYETCVAATCDVLKLDRRTTTFFTGALVLFLATFSALGYGAWGHIRLFGLQFLDFFDFVTNSALMPVVAALTCVFVGWVLKPGAIVEECEACGRVMKTKRFYSFMVRWLAPALMIALLVSEVCRALGIGGWSI